VNLAVHFIRAGDSLILSCFSRSPLFIYYATCGVVEEEKRMMEEGKDGGNQSVLINQENSFPYFIYVVAIISI